MKKEALEILENAVEKVNAAMDAIDNFADANGIQREEPNSIMLGDLIQLVAEEADVCCKCTAKVLYLAFNFLRENELGVVIEEEEEDDD